MNETSSQSWMLCSFFYGSNVTLYQARWDPCVGCQNLAQPNSNYWRSGVNSTRSQFAKNQKSSERDSMMHVPHVLQCDTVRCTVSTHYAHVVACGLECGTHVRTHSSTDLLYFIPYISPYGRLIYLYLVYSLDGNYRWSNKMKSAQIRMILVQYPDPKSLPLCTVICSSFILLLFEKISSMLQIDNYISHSSIRHPLHYLVPRTSYRTLLCSVMLTHSVKDKFCKGRNQSFYPFKYYQSHKNVEILNWLSTKSECCFIRMSRFWLCI